MIRGGPPLVINANSDFKSYACSVPRLKSTVSLSHLSDRYNAESSKINLKVDFRVVRSNQLISVQPYMITLQSPVPEVKGCGVHNDVAG